MKINNSALSKEIIVANGKITKNTVKNLITNIDYDFSTGEEFVVSYYREKKSAYKRFFKEKPRKILSSEMFVTEKDDVLTFSLEIEKNVKLQVEERYFATDVVIKKSLKVSCDADIFLDYVEIDRVAVDTAKFYWSRPLVKEVITTSSFVTALGQPVYTDTLWRALHTPVADSKIVDGYVSQKYHAGRTLSELGGCFVSPDAIIGAATEATMIGARDSFFSYVYTFARKPSMYITFNSWYDYMLNINSDIICNSFTEIYENFKKSGLRPIDCYVIDDGWTDYWQPKFWSVKQDRFPDEFERESKLTKKFGSHFGLWIGPRGGYTNDTYPYALRLKKIGYNVNVRSADICTGDPKYIKDLGELMLRFMREKNVEYFKLDGFAIHGCRNKEHGHPVGGVEDIYFYTFLWEEWCKVFAKMKQQNPDVFINLTSYAHCSPFFLEYASAIWMNNAGDMGYIGEGSNLDKCLNYRDGRYYNLQNERQVQLPSQYIYNHEPNYGQMNYNPPLPNPTHHTVKYTDEEFEKYLYSCLMRGSGFIELYYSPSLMQEGNKYAINARVLKWVESNFDVISNSIYFGGLPVDGKVYGYIGISKEKVIISFRNPSRSDVTYTLPLRDYTFSSDEYELREYYPNPTDWVKGQGDVTVTLKPKEVKILELHYC